MEIEIQTIDTAIRLAMFISMAICIYYIYQLDD